MVGDRLLQVGSLTWDAFHADLRKTFFEGVKPGEITPVTVERNGQTLTIPWRLPGFNRGELVNELASEWFLAYFFWAAGLITVMFLRPKDERWWLFMAFNFLTAIWLGAGSGLSNYHLWYGALILRMAIWLSFPVYLQLHWVFPRPLGKLPPLLVGVVYVATLGLMIAQWLQLFSRRSILPGFPARTCRKFDPPDRSFPAPTRLMRRDMRLMAIFVSVLFPAFHCFGGSLCSRW